MLALGMLSGGLDSSLAVKLILDQGINVMAVKFTSPFCQCDSGGICHAARLAERLGIPYMTVAKGDDYLELVQHPKYGRGANMNVCLDCRIYMLDKAREIADELGAAFVFTGEVLDQRPMSQHRRALRLVEEESGLEGRLLRPLSAKLLPETEAERLGWVDRSKLLDISGRGRRRQMDLADERGLVDYPCPSGGCLLTSKEYSAKLRDHLLHSDHRLTTREVQVLKLGRHFRINGHKTVVGRHESENAMLLAYADEFACLLAPVSTEGPVCLTDADDGESLAEVAAIVARYSDNKGSEVELNVCRRNGGGETMLSSPAASNEVNRHRIGFEGTSITLDSLS